jgi:aminoglycoside phosphotransferase (APT) family kinase protein
MTAIATSATGVAASLRDYLRLRLEVTDLQYVQPPAPNNEGWETFIYRFQLRGCHLPEEFKRPLVLRAYSSLQGLPRLLHEAAVQRHMRERGYPAPLPLLVEESDDPLGGPFMIMELLPGRTLLDELFKRSYRIFHAPVEMAEMQAQLHRMSVDGFPAPEDDFLTRQFQNLAEMIEDYNLSGLRPGLTWLQDHRPRPPATPSILHLDFHPLNMLCRWRKCTGILDWSDSDVGDRHADVAASLVRMRSAPMAIARTLWQKFTTYPGRWMFWKYYFFAYRSRLPVDEQLLAYYMAWAALRRLCLRAACLKAGPRINGCKAAWQRYLSLERVDSLQWFFFEPSGIELEV